jgi:hypothetical protein
MGKTHLSIYGTIDTARHANAAQVRYNPEPTVTVMPNGTFNEFWVTVMPLTSSAFFIITVHRAAPTKSRKLPKTESDDETKNATVCFTTPLIEDFGELLRIRKQNRIELY